MEGPQLTRETICSRAPAALMETLVHAFVVPALRKLREERGTHSVSDDGEIKSCATRHGRVAMPRTQLLPFQGARDNARRHVSPFANYTRACPPPDSCLQC